MPTYAEIVREDVVGANIEGPADHRAQRKAGFGFDPAVELVPRLLEVRFLATFCEAVAHLPEAWLPFLDQGLFETTNFTVKKQVLACPLRTLGRCAVEVALCVLQAAYAEADRAKLAHETHFVERIELLLGRIDMLHVEGQGVTLEAVTDIVELLFDFEHGNRSGRLGLKHRADARPPPAFQLFAGKRRFPAWCDHAKPFFNQRLHIGDERGAINDLDGRDKSPAHLRRQRLEGSERLSENRIP